MLNRNNMWIGITPALIFVSVAILNAVADPPKDSPSVSKLATPVKVEADPLDLKEYCRFKADAFASVKQYPWPSVPHGSQTYVGIPLKISGALILWGERNPNNPEHVKDISVRRKFETLYVYNGAFFEGKKGLPVCEIVMHYSDGTSASDKILCGDDTRDWYADRKVLPMGPTGPRATLAWDVDAKHGGGTQTIRFCMTAIENPHPLKEVTTIDLVSPKTQTAACILAMTTGKSGLMKRPKDESK